MSLKERFDLVILDWGGTVIDFGCEAPVKALIQAFADHGVMIDSSMARRDMGKAKAEHVHALLAMPAVISAWRNRYGRDPDSQDAARVIGRLGPLMREQAALACTLVPGARETFERLRAAGLRVASSTGYTREMMQPVLKRASEQGYQPEHLVCSGETPTGRPSPLMIYKACAELGVWPLSRVVKVDDAEVGITEGKSADAFTIGVASGNTLGMSLEKFRSLPEAERSARLSAAREPLLAAGADLVLDSVADLVPALERVVAAHASAQVR